LSFPCCRDDILIFFEVKNLLDAEDTWNSFAAILLKLILLWEKVDDSDIS
jgi:hypothetical protein